VQWNVNTVRWRLASGISARVCYFADNQRPRLKLTLERVGGRIVRTRKWDGEHVALRLPTGQCHTGQGNCPTELVLWSLGSSCVSSTNSVEAIYASNSSRFNDHAANSIAENALLSLGPRYTLTVRLHAVWSFKPIIIITNNKNATWNVRMNFPISLWCILICADQIQ